MIKVIITRGCFLPFKTDYFYRLQSGAIIVFTLNDRAAGRDLLEKLNPGEPSETEGYVCDHSRSSLFEQTEAGKPEKIFVHTRKKNI